MTLALYLIALMLLAISLDASKYLKSITEHTKRLADAAEREETRRNPPKTKEPNASNWDADRV